MRHTRESLLAELQAIAAKRGPGVTLYAFRQQTGIPPYYIYDRWGSWTNLRKAAGLPVRAHPGPVYSDDDLLTAYHHAAVELDRFPTHTQFNRLSERCWTTLETRFGDGDQVRQKYREWLSHRRDATRPRFLNDCPSDAEPTTVPGLFMVSQAWLRHGSLGLLIGLGLLFNQCVLCGTPLMALLPPAQLVEHPADLVIDVFGAFLGKRSERMTIRWRDPHPQRPAERPRAMVSTTAPRTIATGEAVSSPQPLNDPDSPHPAGPIIDQLRQLWVRDAPAASAARLSPTDRLEQQLNPLAETSRSTAATDWCERIVPLSRLRSVTISGRGVTISSDLIEALVERGIGVSFLSRRGQPVAQLNAPGLNGTVQTRRSQLAAYETPLGVQLAVEFIRGKLRNQKHQLQYSGKYLKATSPQRFEKLTRKIAALAKLRMQLKGFEASALDRVRDKLMGYEGTGARIYWEGVALILEDRVEFPGRQTRGAMDPINSALNYGYGILYSQVATAVANAGLEMYAGFLHVDRPGKPALVLDLVEEFRAPVVDRAVLAIVNQGSPLETDDHGLTAATRKLVADRVLERLSTPVPYEGKRWPLAGVIQSQARHLAVAVRGERTYESFASRW